MKLLQLWIITLLLTACATSNTFDEQAYINKLSPIQRAILVGDIDKVESFLASGVDINALDEISSVNSISLQCPPLFTAVRGRYVDIVQLLLEAGAKPNMPCSPGYMAPLAQVITQINPDLPNSTDDLKILSLLLNYGGDPNLSRSVQVEGRTRVLWSPLMSAVALGKSHEVIKLLLSHGGDPYLKVSYVGENYNALDLAYSAKQEHMIDWLTDSKAGIYEAKLEHLKRSIMLRDSASINALIKDDFTPTETDADAVLFLVLSYISTPDTVDYFIKKKLYYTPFLDYTQIDRRHRSQGVFQFVPMGEQRDAIITLLLDSSLDLSQEGRFLYKSIAQGNTEYVRKLLASGVSPSNQYYESTTPLHFAAEIGNAQITDLLLSHDANANATDAEGRSPLDLAVMHNHLQTASLLKDKGARHNRYRAPVAQDNKSKSGGGLGQLLALAAGVALAANADLSAEQTAGFLSNYSQDVLAGRPDNLSKSLTENKARNTDSTASESSNSVLYCRSGDICASYKFSHSADRQIYAGDCNTVNSCPSDYSDKCSKFKDKVRGGKGLVDWTIYGYNGLKHDPSKYDKCE